MRDPQEILKRKRQFLHPSGVYSDPHRPRPGRLRPTSRRLHPPPPVATVEVHMAAGKPASFYLDPSFRGRRSFTMDLNDPVFDPVFTYALATSPDRPVQDAVRELLLQAVAADQGDGAVRAARMAAYREARHAVFGEINEMFRQLLVRFDNPSFISGESTATLDNFVPREDA